MTDRELLELAAKAAGLTIFTWRAGEVGVREESTQNEFWWSPLEDDGYALRLAVKLKMGLHYESQFLDGHTHRIVEVYHSHEDDQCQCETATYTDDPFAATRRAIVRAAAEVGRQMGGSAAPKAHSPEPDLNWQCKEGDTSLEMEN